MASNCAHGKYSGQHLGVGAMDTKKMTDRAVAVSQDMKGLMENLRLANPALAESMTAKPLMASKTPWGTLAAGGIAWLSSRYGLGLDAEMCALLSGIAVLAGSYAMRYITTSPIAGVIKGAPS